MEKMAKNSQKGQKCYSRKTWMLPKSNGDTTWGPLGENKSEIPC